MVNSWSARFLTNRLTHRRRSHRRRQQRQTHLLAAVERLEVRTLLAAQAVDFGQLRFVGEFAQVGNTYTTSEDVQLGLVPTGSDSYQPLLEFTFQQNGGLTFVTGTSDLSFTVTDATLSSIVQLNPAQLELWSIDGSTSFDAGALTSSGFTLATGAARSFTLFGGQMVTDTILLTNPGTTSGNEVILGGTLTPTSEGDLAVAIGNSNPVVINSQGPNLADFQADILTPFTLQGLTFNPADMSISFDSNSQSFAIWGTSQISTADGGLSSVSASLGSESQPGVTISAGALSDFTVRVEGGSTEMFGLSLSSYDLTLTNNQAGEGLTGYGSVILESSLFAQIESANVGTAQSPGLLIQAGKIEQFTIEIEGSLLLAALPFHTKDDGTTNDGGVNLNYVPGTTTYHLLGTLEVPELFDATVTFAQGDLSLEDGDLNLDGIKIALTDVYLGAFVLDELAVQYHEDHGVVDFDVSAKLWFPGAFWIDATFDFIGAKLNSIGVDFKLTGAGEGIPIGDTGLFIIGMGAEVQNLANPHDLIVSGMVSLSYGPTESFTFFGNTAQGTLLQLDGSFLVDRHEFRAEVDAYIGAYTLGDSTSGLFGEAKAIVTLDWSEGKYEVEIEGGYYGGTFKGKLVADFQSDLFAVLADLEVDIPDAVPFIGGDTLGSLDFALLDVFGDSDESFFAAWAKINLLIHTFHIGFKYTFDGDFKIISGSKIDAIEHEVENPAPQVYNYAATFNSPDGATHATFHVDWGDAGGKQSIAILPAGFDTPIPASEFLSWQSDGSIGLSLVPAFTSATSIGVHIVGGAGFPDVSLLTGPYKVILTSNRELTPTWTSVFGYAEPTISLGPLTNPNLTFSPVAIPIFTTIDSSFADQATVTLYVDTSSSGYGGKPVQGATNVSLPGPLDWSIPWDLTGLNSQPYYLYASINDGFNRPVYSDYIGPFTPIPPIGGAVTDPIHGNAVPGVTVFLDVNGNGQYDAGTDPHDVTNQKGEYAFFGLSPVIGFNDYTVGVVVPAGFQIDPNSSLLFAVEFVGDPLTVNFEIDEFASINGTVFVDANQNGTYDLGETPLSGWTVYLDVNGNGQLDPGELVARTNSRGAYAFYKLATDTNYTVTRVLQPGFYDTGEVRSHTASIGDDQFQKVTGLDFGVLPFSTVSGNMAGHLLSNGTLNPVTTPLDGWTVVVKQQTSINAGGSAAGVYGIDDGFLGGQDMASDHAINTTLVAEPAPQAVYQSYRNGSDFNSFSYTVTGLTPHAPYEVRLDFAETHWDDPGDRIFNVVINGETVLQYFDVLATALGQGVGTGKFVALAPTFATHADNSGVVTIDFTPIVDNPMVNGITVTALTTSLAVNSGGAIQGGFGVDGDFNGGQAAPASSTVITTTGVSAPAPQEVYQTNRYGDLFSYTLTGLIPGAPYALRLHFAETYWNAPGQRVFNVHLDDGDPNRPAYDTILADFDIFAAAGGQNIAVERTFPVIAAQDSHGNGIIILTFESSIDNAQINGIEVIGGTVTAVTDATGNYGVGGLRLGHYVVAQVVPDGWREVSPFTSDLVLATPAGSDIQNVPGGVSALAPVIADFDGNGQLDAAVIDGSRMNLVIYHNGDFDNPTTYPLGFEASAFVAADVLGTGH
ncbi:MAG: hypothetical protein KF861_08290, partial [Planctomycetaceae bacterium]|nr:hypothetical protein [Planctomycetaceae bacterium]